MTSTVPAIPAPGSLPASGGSGAPGLDTGMPPRTRTGQAHSRLAAVRARLELPVVRRASGLLDGRHRSIFSGHGQDFDEMAQYLVGDDIGDIDWKASASTGVPIIRRFERESNLAMVLAVDTGRSMAALAPSGEVKGAIAQFACDVIGYLARGRGDLLALVAGDAERTVQIPARGGTEHMEMLLQRINGMLALDGPPSNVTHVLDRVLTWFTRRSLVVVVTDEVRPPLESEQTIKRLRTRHELMVIQVADALPTDFGSQPVEDVESPLGLPEFFRARRDMAAEARDAVARRRSDVAAMLRRYNVPTVTVGSEAEVVDGLADLLARSRRARH
ncbi:uncharacterized protein DUF58 [Salana multivorans]|uniref:Uncharacterized protein DUF58 n=1 Tax=Salana multivorans TaxID=120377 RepID=A0A3N2D9N0_9MICO|nr:DUF58 domain-containing protein [Salana multivorans]ROR96506.1 uncharacterized protein DUF58 [Salana multivorans]